MAMGLTAHGLNGLVCSLLLLGLSWSACALRDPFGKLRLPTDRGEEEGVGGEYSRDDDETTGKRWAVLVAGSHGYANYRHQADVCHAYQVLHRNGLKDENIIVFMFDDIAFNDENPRPGTIINSPNGADVYKGVPKDYTGHDVRASVFLHVLAGNKEAVRGIGSERVLASGPNDHVFIFYSDHGGPGVLGTPYGAYLYADDFNAVLKAKHESRGFKEMVIYLEACESGSIFEGMLRPEWNIYATTASNAYESSWGTYCPDTGSPPPREYETCLGDLFSVAWMEDSETHNLNKETLLQQYRVVKARTSMDQDTDYPMGSHVMQYGNTDIDLEECAMYLGSDPQFANRSPSSTSLLPLLPQGEEGGEDKKLASSGQGMSLSLDKDSRTRTHAVLQRDAELVHLWAKYSNSLEGSARKAEALEELNRVTSERARIDRSVKLIGSVLFGVETGAQLLNAVRAQGLPLVDDWNCLKSVVRAFESSCGQLTQYGMKHMRSFANICNEHIPLQRVQKAAAAACADHAPSIVGIAASSA